MGAGGLGCTPDADARRPDVLLVTIDTLRADFVHGLGFEHPITPNLDALAARGAVFETAIAASTATAPAHASLMTSRFVREHSIGAVNGASRLVDRATLAERFADAGWDTAAFVSNVVLKSRIGLDRGFQRYDDALPDAEPNRAMYLERDAPETVARALAWLAERPGREAGAPFFLWVHLQEPHGPYTPPPPFDARVPPLPLRTERVLPVLSANRGRGGLPAYQRLEGVRTAPEYAARYAGEVAYVDDWLGRLVDGAEAASVGAGGLAIAVTADHGESLDEEGFFFQHGHSATPEQARVPMLLVGPGVAPARVAGVASHVDLAPTLLELAGLPPLPEASGISWLPHLASAQLPERIVFSDVGHEVGAYDAVGWTRIRGEGPARDALRLGYDGRRGPDAPLAPAVRAYLATETEIAPAEAMDPEDIERLRALGYLPPAEAFPPE